MPTADLEARVSLNSMQLGSLRTLCESLETRLLARCKALERELRQRDERLSDQDDQMENRLSARCKALEAELRHKDGELASMRARLSRMEATSLYNDDPNVLQASAVEMKAEPAMNTGNCLPFADDLPQIRVVEAKIPAGIMKEEPLASIKPDPERHTPVLTKKKRKRSSNKDDDEEYVQRTRPKQKRKSNSNSSSAKKKAIRIGPVRDRVVAALGKLSMGSGTMEEILEKLEHKLTQKQVRDALTKARWQGTLENIKVPGQPIIYSLKNLAYSETDLILGAKDSAVKVTVSKEATVVTLPVKPEPATVALCETPSKVKVLPSPPLAAKSDNDT